MKSYKPSTVKKFIFNLTLILSIMTNIECNSQNEFPNQYKNGHKTNRLINEKSPYLLQHAYNPVDWYPWGKEAFDKAKKENKPIFLSIGYSTCHWCHVMEKESFEDSTVADLLNKYYVSIKVDREERPDIDNIYMTVAQILTGSGGWPLTIIMTHDKKPFFAGTYFPKDSRFGRPGMLDILPQIATAWEKDPDEILNTANRVIDAVKQTSNSNPNGSEITLLTLKIAEKDFANKFDKIYGGFGNAPKFPSPHNLLFLLRQYNRDKNSSTLNMVKKTLDKMEDGGIYDQLGFGFHRYSTDEKWLVPHFEKMIYDQAMLAMAYTEAYQLTRDEKYKKTAEGIFTYVLRDMTSKEGGFYTAEDADSDGEEGKFYFWTYAELQKILSKKDFDLFVKVFNVEKDGNFVDQIKGGKDGNNILHRTKPYSELANEFNTSEKDIVNKIDRMRKQLFAIREKRIHPFKDDKILTDWNGLMIAALAQAGNIFNNQNYTLSAEKSIQFVFDKMTKKDGTLFHRFRNGEVKIDAHLDDYAFIIWGLLNLYEATFKTEYLKKAIVFNNLLIKHFWDYKNGGFYFTSDDSPELFTRQKEIYDGAIPSGNSVAMMNIVRLSRITGDSKLADMASQLAKTFSNNVERYPMGYSQLLSGVDFAIGPSFEIVIVGDITNYETKRMLNEINKKYIPNKVVLLKSDETEYKDISEIATYTKEQKMINGEATVYVCRNYVCNLPTTDPKKLAMQLNIK